MEMRSVLLISSFVAANHVGASASAFCLRRLGVQTYTLPTTLFGRHPGWGNPGGQPTPNDILEGIWEGIWAQDLRIDAVMTGYLANASQVILAANIIGHLKAKNPEIFVLVDPVMGDNGRLYVQEETALEIQSRLIPLANLITPNIWEFGYITKTAPQSVDDVVEASAQFPSNTLITSVPEDREIGALLSYKNEINFEKHPKFETVPHGGGDALAALYLAHSLNGMEAKEALSRSTAAVYNMLKYAVEHDASDLPLIENQDKLLNPPHPC